MVDRRLVHSLSVGLVLAVSAIAWANETFPAVHDAPIRVQIRSGLNGKPVLRVHLLAVAGYNEEDLRQQMWREEALTDGEGKAYLSSRISNLPFLQVWVTGASLCQDKPRIEAFSVDRVRRDGLSTPNRCGVITSVDEPGLFTVFVKPSKKLLFQNSSSPVAAEIAVESEVGLPGPVRPRAVVAAIPQPVPPASTPLAAAGTAAPVAVAANLTAPAKPVSQPVKDAPTPIQVPAPAIQALASSASVPTVTPVAPLPPPVPAALVAAPVAGPVKTPVSIPSQTITPVALIDFAQNSAAIQEPETESSGATTKPAAAKKQHRSLVRRAASTAAKPAGPHHARAAVAEVPKQTAKAEIAQEAVKPGTPAPPAPKIAVSLEAAPPPAPSLADDANPRPKPVASRRPAAERRASALKTKHRSGAVPRAAVKAAGLPATTSTAGNE